MLASARTTFPQTTQCEKLALTAHSDSLSGIVIIANGGIPKHMRGNFGSSWKRWDLHVHTPASIRENYGGAADVVWEQFVSDIETLPDNLKVIGINDYLFLDGYKYLQKLKTDGRMQNVEMFLPVIELRVDAFGNLNSDDGWKKVNMHVIFSDEVHPEVIEAQFINVMQKSLKLSPDNGGFWSGAVPNRQALEEFGAKIRANSAVKPPESDLIVGFNNLTYDFDTVVEVLKNANTFFAGKWLIAIGKTEWDALRWTGSAAEKMNIINRSNFVFTAAASPEAFNNAKAKLKAEGVNDLLLDCSDAHNFSYSADKDRIGNCFTWIKSDSTFEGLKQVLHEETRLRVAADNHLPPAKWIRSVKLGFPEGCIIFRKDSKNDTEKHSEFCLVGEQSIYFSPYLTCLIGGRGSGKSTILNLIAEKAGTPTRFFAENIIRDSKGHEDVTSHVEIEGSNDIEFISQNEVEKFAEAGELTQAIYSRLRTLVGISNFESLEETMNAAIAELGSQIGRIVRLIELDKEIKSTTSELRENESIVNSYSSPEYTSLTTQIESIGSILTRIDSAKGKFDELNTEIRGLLTRFTLETNTGNDYEVAANQIIEKLEEIGATNFDFSRVETEQKFLEAQRTSTREQLQKYLDERGASEQNKEDYDRASVLVPELKAALETLQHEHARLTNQIDTFRKSGDTSDIVKRNLEAQISEALIPLNQQLVKTNTNPNVEDIRFEYEFNLLEAKERLFEKFLLQFPSFTIQEFRTQKPSVKEHLFCVEPLDVDSLENYLARLDEGRNPNAKEFLKAIFADTRNFEIYKLLIHTIFCDVNEFKRIKGYYGDRELRSCSFGQRCTAVIVALIMFGNRPLIIDEPEAHLDSKLIAEYLVDLIKNRKLDRQIIFATHNANFVVNGDAELINILEVETNNRTRITPTTIEDIANRPKLLNLEGGKEAFEKRDRRLIKTQAFYA